MLACNTSTAHTTAPSCLQNVRAGGPAAGALFWTFYAEGQRAPAEEGGTASGLFGELLQHATVPCNTGLAHGG